MEELTILEKTICICGFVICPIIMFLIAKEIVKDIKNMKNFEESIFGEIKAPEKTKNINDIPNGYS